MSLPPAAPAAGPVASGAPRPDRMEPRVRSRAQDGRHPGGGPDAATPPANPPRSPLAARISQLLGEERAGTLRTAAESFAALLGVDPGVALDVLRSPGAVEGQFHLSLELKDGVRHRLPYEGGRPVEVFVPSHREGTRALLDVSLGTTPEGDPTLKSVDIRFVDATFGNPLPQSLLPRVVNPSALESSGKPLLDMAMDAAADIAFRGLHVDQSGSIILDADVAILQGLKTEDFHTRAEGKLPKLRMGLTDFGVIPAEGEAAAEVQRGAQGSTGKDISLDALMTGLGASMRAGRWEATMSVAGDNGAELRGRGEVAPKGRTGLTMQADVAVGLAGQERAVALQAEHQTEGVASGAARLQVRGASAAEVPLELSWGRDGLAMESLEAMLPLDLKPWPGPGPAPALGTPRFKARLAELLDTAAPVRTGNEVSFLRHGTQVLEERLRLLRSAGVGDTVVLQTFILHDDTTGGMIIDELIAAKKRGADVKVLLDAAGCAVEARDAVDGGAAFRRLRAAGVDAHLFNSAPPVVEAIMSKLSTTLQAPPLDAAARAAFPAVARLFDRLEEVQRTQGIEELLTPEHGVSLAPVLVAAVQELKSVPRENGPARVVRLARAFWPSLDHVGSLDQSALLRDLLPQLARDHRKLLAVYGTTVDGTPRAEMLLGGNNIDDTYQLEPDSPLYSEAHHGTLDLWNDADLRVVGRDAVADAVRGFARDFPGAPLADVPQGATSSPPRGGAALRVVQHRPLATGLSEGDNHFTNAVLAVLEGADWGTEIAIENPFFVPVPELRDAMTDAARRGARIKIVTNGLADNHENQLVSRHVRQFIYPELLQEKNIEVYETNASQQPVHRKTLVARTRADEHLYVVGSQNFDRLSAAVNRELFVIGGAAASDRGDRWHNEQVARELWRDLARDTEPSYATRVDPKTLTLPAEDALAGYARSLGKVVF
ncbi:MAG: phospholipase D-like domain-containing protein [Myxococcota bacterium]